MTIIIAVMNGRERLESNFVNKQQVWLLLSFSDNLLRMGFWFYWHWREIGRCYICVILDGLSFIHESVQTRSRLIYLDGETLFYSTSMILAINRFQQLFFSFNINNEFDINITKSNFKSNPNPSIKLILVFWKNKLHKLQNYYQFKKTLVNTYLEIPLLI
jgi:hypothetical protein